MNHPVVFMIGLCVLSPNLVASPLTYAPVNPSFIGGNPANGGNLLNEANAENNIPNPNTGSTPQTPLQQFSNQVQSLILSRVATAASSQLFNASGQLIPGTVQTENFQITIAQVAGAASGTLQITTVDKLTGQTTSFQITGQGQ